MRQKFTEKRLLYRVTAHQDPEAFGELYDRYIAKIYRFIYFKVASKEEAEDVTSDVFLKTWNYLTQKDVGEVKSFSGLMYKIARNCLVDYYRQKTQRKEDSLETILTLGVHDDRYREIGIEQEVANILKVMTKLKREYQEIVLLKYIEDLSVSEIADILDKTKTNVRVTLHRALKIIKELTSDQKE